MSQVAFKLRHNRILQPLMQDRDLEGSCGPLVVEESEVLFDECDTKLLCCLEDSLFHVNFWIS
jgi:hypothetical protein